MFEAAKGHHYGLSAELAIQAVTSVPAERLGQDHRIGYVRAGYDADLVIWDKHPLEIGAHPLRVFTDGYTTFEHKEYKTHIPLPFAHKPEPLNPLSEATVLDIGDFGETLTATFVNISGLIHSKTAENQVGSKLVIENGIVKCIGAACVTVGKEISVNGGWVTPGLVAAGVHLGLEIIQAEPVTSAGVIQHQSDDVLESALGIQVGRTRSRLLDAAFKGGVTTAISSLQFQGSIGAIGTAFRVGAEQLRDDTFVKKNCGRSFRVGMTAKSGELDRTVPGQLHRIKKVGGISNKTELSIVEVNGANHIYSIIGSTEKSAKVVIQGGAEAHVMAKELAQANFGVLLSPARCTPADWFKLQCLTTSTTPSDVEILLRAGVKVGLSVPEDNFLRGLIWEAGWKVSDFSDRPKMNDFEFAKQVVSLVTWNVAEMYGIDAGTIAVGKRANFVVYDGVPGTLSAKVKLVVDGDLIETETTQY
jgi:hypothetical protein